jgi:alanine racemase
MLSHLQISRPTLLHNYHQFRQTIPANTTIMCVVKANAYGHGLREVVESLKDEVQYFAVDDLDEFKELRKVTDKPCLLLGYVPLENLEEVIQLNGELGVYNLETFQKLQQIAENICSQDNSPCPGSPTKQSETGGCLGGGGVSSKLTGTDTLKGTVNVHLCIDSLLGRDGILPQDLDTFLTQAKEYDQVNITAYYSHFANVEDTTDQTHARKQIETFEQIESIFKAHGYDNIRKHISATASSMLYETGQNDFVRLGIGLYGLWPAETLKTVKNQSFDLKPVLRWVSHIAQVKTLPTNSTIGYGLTYTTHKETKIAVIPQGYCDGLDRQLSNTGEVLIQSTRCKILGRISMNMCVVDVSHLENLKLEEEVILLGTQTFDGRSETITAEEIAQKCDTINYEIVARLNHLLPRLII